MAADYIYKNVDDSVRVRVFRRIGGRWDYDYATGRSIETFSTEAGDDFRTKAEAFASAASRFGPLSSINPKGTWVK